MTALPLNQALTRFITNEDRYDTFVNGSDTASYTSSGGALVPSVRKFLSSLDSQIAYLLEGAKYTVDTKALASALNLDLVDFVTVNRWDGTSPLCPATYRKVSSAPSHDMYFTDTNGNVFEIYMPYIDIRMRGANPNAETDVAAAGCADAINAAYTAAHFTSKSLFIPAGTWMVHVDAEDIDTSASATYRIAALMFYRNNVDVFGSPESTLKCFSALGSYGVIQLSKGPLTNGDYELSGGGLRSLVVDGNCADTSGYEGNQPCITAEGLRDYVFDLLYVKNSGSYGIGLQNGGYANVKVLRSVIENTAKDGIDLKDNSDATTGKSIGINVHIDNLVLRGVCQAYDDQPSAMVDVMGAGLVVENIFVESLPTSAAANYSAVVRVKQGIEGIGRGFGGQQAVIRNVSVKWDGGIGPENAIVDIRAPYVMVENVRHYGTPPAGMTGVFLCQAFCTVSGGNLSGLNRGVFCQSKLGDGDEWPFDGADDCTIMNVTMHDCTEAAVLSVRDRTRVLFNSMNGSLSGAKLTASGANGAEKGIVIGNDMTGVTNPFPFTNNGIIAHSNAGTYDLKMFALMESGRPDHALLTAVQSLRFGVGLDDAGSHYGLKDIVRMFSSASTVADTVNRLDIVASGAGGALSLRARGSEADTDLALVPQGSGGRVRVGSHSATSDVAITGYIEVKDSSGTVRKLAVIS